MFGKHVRQVLLACGDGAYGHATVHVVRGERAVLRLQHLLIGFSEVCGTPSGTLLDLPYFLQKPGLLQRIPYLILVSRRSGAGPEALDPTDLLGSVLLMEYSVFGIGLRAFATNDRSGSGTLLALPEDKMSVAAAACELLVSRGAHVVMLSFTGKTGSAYQASFQRFSNPLLGLHWAVRTRCAPAYLQLHPTFEATLAQLGQKTRSNMRYYRRKAERELGCTFAAEACASDEELLRFNQQCMYAVDERTLRWRLKMLKTLAQPYLMGMQDKEGRWLSILAGRRFGGTSEILWQMNRDGYPAHSFSTVLRSHCIEHEIARGEKRLQVEGGTFHSMHHSFETEELADFVVIRPVAKRFSQMLVSRYVPPDNSLAHMLKGSDLTWQRG